MSTMSTTTSTWLITGASSGLGKSLALAALKAGYRVIGTTRDVAKAESQVPEFSANGGIWVALDPGDKEAYHQFAKVSTEYGVNVLVNNAGYAFIGGVEDTRYDIRCSWCFDICGWSCLKLQLSAKMKSETRWK